jgi:hypothetical protein
MPADKAAAVLGSYLGVPSLEPAAVLDLDVDQITGVLVVRVQHSLFGGQHIVVGASCVAPQAVRRPPTRSTASLRIQLFLV